MTSRDSACAHRHLKWVFTVRRNFNLGHVRRFEIFCIWRSHWIQVCSFLQSVGRRLIQDAVNHIGRTEDIRILGSRCEGEFRDGVGDLLAVSILVLDLILAFDRYDAFACQKVLRQFTLPDQLEVLSSELRLR